MVAVVGGPVPCVIVFVGSLHLFRRLASLICFVCTPIVIPASAITNPKLASFIFYNCPSSLTRNRFPFSFLMIITIEIIKTIKPVVNTSGASH